jgi:hypothetical protein
MRINLLKPGGLAKPKQLVMDKSILNSEVSQGGGSFHDGLCHINCRIVYVIHTFLARKE